jgi:hypothetical protein
MSVGTVDSVGCTVQKTNEWVAQLADELGTEDRARPEPLRGGRGERSTGTADPTGPRDGPAARVLRSRHPQR